MPHDSPGTRFFDAKDHREIRTGSPLWGHQTQVGYRYKSATVDE